MLSQLKLLGIYQRELSKNHGCAGAALAAVAEAAVKDAVGGDEPDSELLEDLKMALDMYQENGDLELAGEQLRIIAELRRLSTKAKQASAAVPEGFVLVEAAALIRWRSAFSEELSGYDIDPPLHHVKTSHDEIDALLKAGGAG